MLVPKRVKHRKQMRGRRKGKAYTGSYVGAGSGTAGLAGSRNGNTISLGIRWAKEVNGDQAINVRFDSFGAFEEVIAQGGLRPRDAEKEKLSRETMHQVGRFFITSCHAKHGEILQSCSCVKERGWRQTIPPPASKDVG